MRKPRQINPITLIKDKFASIYGSDMGIRGVMAIGDLEEIWVFFRSQKYLDEFPLTEFEGIYLRKLVDREIVRLF